MSISDELLSIYGSFIFWCYDLFSLLQILLKSCVVSYSYTAIAELCFDDYKHTNSLCFSSVFLETKV